MTTVTVTLGGATLKRMTTGAWQTTQAAGMTVKQPSIMPVGLVKTPFLGVRKSTVSTITDKLVPPSAYRGKP